MDGCRDPTYGSMALPPSINALQYGLAVFEGLKAFRTVSDEIVLFRPRENHERLRRSCRRLVLPEVPEELFLSGLRQLVAIDASWVPRVDEGSLYIRPCVFATDENIRVKRRTRACSSRSCAQWGAITSSRYDSSPRTASFARSPAARET